MAETTGPISPVGATHRDSMRRRARGAAHREELERLRPLERVARLVIARRAELGLTQAELAERVGTSHSAISRIESGQHRTNVDTLQRLAAALETELEISFRHASEAREEREFLPA